MRTGSHGEDVSISLEEIAGPAEDPDKLPNAITKYEIVLDL